MCIGRIGVIAGCLVLIGWAIYFSIVGAIIYVAYHFVTKYW